MLGDFFNLVLIHPLTNLFVLLSALTGSAGIGVILLTIIIRAVTYPLYLKQMHSTRMMAVLGPRMQELSKKYKDPRRRQEETMKLYREAGINPLGCVSSMIVQFPILFALYRTFSVAVGETPEALVQVSARLYPWDYLRHAMPLNGEFLWLHLGRPDPLLLPVLAAATTYILQKMTAMPTMDERQQAQNRMMNLMMPLIFGWFTITLPSGLGLYYVLSNLIGMAMQYFYVGGGPINWRALVGISQDAVLPRAMDVRQAQMDAAKRFGRDDAEDDDKEGVVSKGTPPTGDGTAAARRRRYTNGRRRGRR